jgi:hypothetical protein
MTTEAGIRIIRPAHLVQYHKLGLKLVSIGNNGLPSMKWGPIYDDPNYWTEDKLVQQVSDFKYGVATVFGKTRLRDEQGPLYLNDLDIDSDAVYVDCSLIHSIRILPSILSKVYKPMNLL